MMPLACFLQATSGKLTRINFIDSTSLEVCHPNQAKQHKVLKDQAGWGKSSGKWCFGLKLYLIANNEGELLAATLIPENTDEGLIAYSYHPTKPSPDLNHIELETLPMTIP